VTDHRLPDRASHRATDPVVRLLGPGAARHGPFGVLGLAPADVDDEAVVGAVHERMAAIDRHPEARTPAADEARLAVHAAAANLLDPGVRAALLERLGVDRSTSSSTRPTEAPPVPNRSEVPAPRRAVSRARLEADLLRSIGAAGGWGPAARDRFVKLAHARGYDAGAAVESIQSLTGAIGAPTTSRDLAGASRPFAAPGRVDRAAPLVSVARDMETDEPRAMRVAPEPARDSALTAVLIVCTVVVLMVLVAGVTLLLIGSDPASSELNAARPSRPVQPQTAPRAAEPDPEESPASARLLDNAPAILHELEVATEGTAVDTDAALAGFELAVESLAARWVGFSQADRLAAQDQIVGFLYRVSGRRAPLARAAEAIGAGLTPADRGGRVTRTPSRATPGRWARWCASGASRTCPVRCSATSTTPSWAAGGGSPPTPRPSAPAPSPPCVRSRTR
jgi:hypothetical protein